MDASEACHDLSFHIGQKLFDAVAVTDRKFSIKITQFACGFNNLAPSGCTQYYYGTGTGYVQSFNFASAQHLANQKQVICVR